MTLLTEQEITEIVRESARDSAIRRDGTTSFRIARAIETAVIEKIKAQGVAVWSCDVLQTDATFKQEFSAIEPPLDYYSVRNIAGYYRLPEGD